MLSVSFVVSYKTIPCPYIVCLFCLKYLITHLFLLWEEMYTFFRKWLPSSSFLFFYSIESVPSFSLELSDFWFWFGTIPSFLDRGFPRQLLFLLKFLASFLFFRIFKFFQDLKYSIASMESSFFFLERVYLSLVFMLQSRLGAFKNFQTWL